MEMHSVANLASYLGLDLPLSLSLSLGVSDQRAAAGGEEQHFQLNTDIMLLASLILHIMIAEITTQLLSLSCVFDFIRRRLDYKDFCAD